MLPASPRTPPPQLKPNEEESSVALVNCTAKGVVTLVNAPFLEMFGQGSTVVGQNIAAMFTRSSAAQVENMLADVTADAEGEMTASKQLEAVHKNKTIFPVALAVTHDKSEAFGQGGAEKKKGLVCKARCAGMRSLVPRSRPPARSFSDHG